MKTILFFLAVLGSTSTWANPSRKECVEQTRDAAITYIKNNFDSFIATEFQCGQIEAKKFGCLITGNLKDTPRLTLTIQFQMTCEPIVQE